MCNETAVTLLWALKFESDGKLKDLPQVKYFGKETQIKTSINTRNDMALRKRLVPAA
jgi:hypothetical protein